MRLAFGKLIVTGEEDVLKRILRVVHTVERVASPGAYLVDTLPSLMNIPEFLSPFKKEDKKLHAEELDLFRTLFEAGAGTTAAAMMSFLLAMMLHPEAMRKLQEEVDSVIGEDLLPRFEDIERFPRDDVYELDGKKIFLEVGSNVHANQWAIHRDPDLYHDPEDFIPERWLESKWPTFREPLGTYPNLQNYSAFGFGRRICPGQNIAERSLNILVARIAWGCDIEEVDDWDYSGYRYTKGFNVQPEKFLLTLKARKGREEVVNRGYEDVWPELVRQARK
ncbi:hypothetical protein IFR05_003112 [Cadophora sp. M221]|nr:hypothetical protein IFR05_003112 [Cadophora sp. M221]